MSRWQLDDPVTLDSYVFEMSPNEMTSPLLSRPVELGLTGMDGGARSMRRRPPAKEWSFTGTIRTQAMHDTLLAWSQRPNPVVITDHFGRVFPVLLLAFNTTEQQPTPRTLWRFKYTMTALVLGGPQ